MDAEEMRIAIAKKCGWTIGTEGYGWPGESIGEFRPLPNYPADLNAMHEALNTLTNTQFYTSYRGKLSEITFEKSLTLHARRFWEPTAAEKAEAFCRVFWPERFKE